MKEVYFDDANKEYRQVVSGNMIDMGYEIMVLKAERSLLIRALRKFSKDEIYWRVEKDGSRGGRKSIQKLKRFAKLALLEVLGHEND